MANDPILVLQKKTLTDTFYLLTSQSGALSFLRSYVPFQYPDQGFKLCTFVGMKKLQEFLDRHPGLRQPNVRICQMIFSNDGCTITFREFDPNAITRA